MARPIGTRSPRDVLARYKAVHFVRGHAKFMRTDMWGAMGRSGNRERIFIRRMIADGILADDGRTIRRLHVPPPDWGAPPRTKSAHAWRAMRIRRRFIVNEVAAASGASVNTLQRQVARLSAAGYVRRERAQRGGADGGAVWRLIRDTGPCAPVLLGDGTVYDVNENIIYGAIEAGSESGVGADTQVGPSEGRTHGFAPTKKGSR